MPLCQGIHSLIHGRISTRSVQSLHFRFGLEKKKKGLGNIVYLRSVCCLACCLACYSVCKTVTVPSSLPTPFSVAFADSVGVAVAFALPSTHDERTVVLTARGASQHVKRATEVSKCLDNVRCTGVFAHGLLVQGV